MRESYCGKSCAECMRREELNCPGCRPEEGRRVPTSCIIAACCNKSGHETCESCMHKQNFCQTLKEKDDYPQRHIREEEAAARRQEEQRQKMQERRERGVFLLRHFNILCILWAITCVCNLVDKIGGEETVFHYIAEGFTLARMFVIYDMAKVNQQYKTVFFLGLSMGAVGLATWFFNDANTALAFVLLLLTIPGIYGEWLELSTHGEVLCGIDDIMAGKWEKLAGWTAAANIVIAGGTLFALLIPAFILLVLPGTIALAVFAILQVVYLFRTRKSLSFYVEANVPKA